jgi:hypothetical protein
MVRTEFNRIGAEASASAWVRLGQSPLIPSSLSSGQRRGLKSQAAPAAKVAADVVLALQEPLQGRKPGPRIVLLQEAVQRDLELQDTAQSLPVNKRRPVERGFCPARQLSPFVLAVQRAHAQLPPHWNKRPRPLGLAVSELKAALALLILNHHAQLLELPAEGFESSEA